MKTIIKIVLALAVLTAAAQAGMAAFANYQFQDDVHDRWSSRPIPPIRKSGRR